MASKKDLELNEKRKICAIRSCGLTANYVGLADGKFDEKEKEQAQSSTCVFFNWNSLFYMDEEDDIDEQMRAGISNEINSIANSDVSPAAILDELKKQLEIAKTLNKYSQIVDKDWGGTADWDKDVSTYTSRNELRKIMKAEKLEVKEDDCKSEDGFDLDRFHNLVIGELSDPFAPELGTLLLAFGCSIAEASGGFLGFGKKRSKLEVQAIYDIEKAWGTDGNADLAMMVYDVQIKLRKSMNKALRKMF